MLLLLDQDTGDTFARRGRAEDEDTEEEKDEEARESSQHRYD